MSERRRDRLGGIKCQIDSPRFRWLNKRYEDGGVRVRAGVGERVAIPFFGCYARIDRKIDEHQKAIRKLEEELKTGSLPRRLHEAEAELRDFEKSGHERIAEVQRQIDAIKAEDGIGRLERQIEDLHADTRVAEVERRMKPALERLKAGLP